MALTGQRIYNLGQRNTAKKDNFDLNKTKSNVNFIRHDTTKTIIKIYVSRSDKNHIFLLIEIATRFTIKMFSSNEVLFSQEMLLKNIEPYLKSFFFICLLELLFA